MADVKIQSADPLAGLIDIPLPQEVSLWPQTWPLRMAIALIVIGASFALWRGLYRFHCDKYRREALGELDQIRRATDVAPDQVAKRLGVLMRRTALAAFPRDIVAPLTGPAWLAFLDGSYGGHAFSQGAGRLLASGPYQRSLPERGQLDELIGLVRLWIRRHHV